jgi:hypothetical protein
LRLRSLSFFSGPLLPSFIKVIEHELLIIVVQQLEDIYSTVRTNLRT